MATHEEPHRIAGALDDLGAALRREPSVRGEVMQRVTRHAATHGGAPPALKRWRGLGKFAAAVAACAAIAVLAWGPWGRGIGATEVFAAAIGQVQQARTFTCRQIVTQAGAGGEPLVRETLFAFKEPHLERIESVGGGGPPQVTVTDYGKRVRLVLHPADGRASLQDMSTTYTTDDQTGRLKPTELGTHARDDLLSISAAAVEDLGQHEVDGRGVRVLRTDHDAEPVTTVYVDTADGSPVRVEQAWPSRGQTIAYADIRIDGELDDALFGLEPPAGYVMDGGRRDAVQPVDDVNGKMMAKVMRVTLECFMYANDHGGKWPTRLDDLRAAGMDAKALRTLLAADGSKDGKPVILYRRPTANAAEPQIVVYEAPEVRRPTGVVCGFTDGHAEVVPLARFEQLMKQPADGDGGN